MISHALQLARLALRFSRVERITCHEDGVRPETDSDHTVMLTLVACDLAPQWMNRGRIAEFAMVHDLPEAYTGDTNTLTIDAAGRAAKAERDRVAVLAMASQYGSFTWLGATLLAYAKQEEPEARWVHVMDKVLPKLTHALNGCAAVRRHTNFNGLRQADGEQWTRLTTEYRDDTDVSEALFLLREAMDAAEGAWGSHP